MNEIKLENNYWVIGTNKWSSHIFTQEQADKYSTTLINCENCINCSDCSGCRDCRYCRGCSYCSDCSDCRYCSYCSYCRDCRDCSGCSYFKTNPQRIISPNLGSRNSQTTFYWNEEKEQIICGCFKGTLQEFELKVKETHNDNEFAKGYFQWIAALKNYKLTYGGNK